MGACRGRKGKPSSVIEKVSASSGRPALRRAAGTPTSNTVGGTGAHESPAQLKHSHRDRYLMGILQKSLVAGQQMGALHRSNRSRIGVDQEASPWGSVVLRGMRTISPLGTLASSESPGLETEFAPDGAGKHNLTLRGKFQFHGKMILPQSLLDSKRGKEASYVISLISESA